MDIFDEAAKDSILESKGKTTRVGKKVSTLETKNHKPVRKRRTNKELSKKGEMMVKQWDSLKSDIVGIHSERFNAVLDGLPDKEFVKTYLNILEYFKPKVTRIEGLQNAVTNTTINIKINRGNKEETIDVTPKNDEK